MIKTSLVRILEQKIGSFHELTAYLNSCRNNVCLWPYAKMTVTVDLRDKPDPRIKFYCLMLHSIFSWKMTLTIRLTDKVANEETFCR